MCIHVEGLRTHNIQGRSRATVPWGWNLHGAFVLFFIVLYQRAQTDSHISCQRAPWPQQVFQNFPRLISEEKIYICKMGPHAYDKKSPIHYQEHPLFPPLVSQARGIISCKSYDTFTRIRPKKRVRVHYSNHTIYIYIRKYSKYIWQCYSTVYRHTDRWWQYYSMPVILILKKIRLHVCKGALNVGRINIDFHKRALCTRQRALHVCKRAVIVRGKAPDRHKRAQDWHDSLTNSRPRYRPNWCSTCEWVKSPKNKATQKCSSEL